MMARDKGKRFTVLKGPAQQIAPTVAMYFPDKPF
jgi:hypothetical protein